MSEARALTNFAGNSVATVLIAHWTGGLDRPQLDRVLAGDDPFDETTMVDDDDDFDHVPPGAAAAHAGVVPELAADRPGLSPAPDTPRPPVRPSSGADRAVACPGDAAYWALLGALPGARPPAGTVSGTGH